MKSKKFESDTAQKILSAAIGLISRDGFANVSMRDIAAEAGVALSHLNYYYKNKEGLFLAVIRTVKKCALEDFTYRMKMLTDEEKKRDFIFTHAKDSVRNNPYIYRLLLDFSNLALWSAPFKEEFDKLVDETAEVIRVYTSQGGQIVSAAEKYTERERARFLIALNLGVSAQYLSVNSNGAQEKTEEVLKIFDFIENAMK